MPERDTGRSYVYPPPDRRAYDLYLRAFSASVSLYEVERELNGRRVDDDDEDGRREDDEDEEVRLGERLRLRERDRDRDDR